MRPWARSRERFARRQAHLYRSAEDHRLQQDDEREHKVQAADPAVRLTGVADREYLEGAVEREKERESDAAPVPPERAGYRDERGCLGGPRSRRDRAAATRPRVLRTQRPCVSRCKSPSGPAISSGVRAPASNSSISSSGRSPKSSSEAPTGIVASGWRSDMVWSPFRAVPGPPGRKPRHPLNSDHTCTKKPDRPAAPRPVGNPVPRQTDADRPPA